MYIVIDDQGRVIASCSEGALSGGIEVARPDGWNAEEQHDWRLDAGELVYDPAEEVTAEDPTGDAICEIAELAAENAARLDEQDAAIVELASIMGGE